MAMAVLMDIETYQDTEDAFALMNIIRLAEKDITDGNVKKAGDVFKNIKEIIAKKSIGYSTKKITKIR